MKGNVSFSLGPLALIERIEQEFNFLGKIMEGLGGKAKHLLETTKLLIYNKLCESLSVCKIKEFYPYELFEKLGFKEDPKERSVYRNLERIGINHQFILGNYQELIQINNLISYEQFIDFSSAYFEGDNAELGALGYSRDNQPGKKQITFGIATGMNDFPTGLTIQNGNVPDKTHFKFMFDTVKKVLKAGSILIFDCGANTKKNKEKIKDALFNYLTLKSKHVKSYLKYLKIFQEQEKEIFTINGVEYKCVKIIEENEIKYIFFSEKAKREQLEKKERRFKKALERGDKILSKMKKGKELAKFITREGDILAKGELQKNLTEVVNPFIMGLEGFFILESSVDESSEKILKLYKDRDKAEKLVRAIKEGTELRPIRHWSKNAVIGYILIVFLTNCIVKLSDFLNKNTVGKNLKLLKKSLKNLTVTVVYRENNRKFEILSNISEEIKAIFGNFIEKYIDWGWKLG
jgi:transposase